MTFVSTWTSKDIAVIDGLIQQGQVRKQHSALFPHKSYDAFKQQVNRRKKILGVSHPTGRPRLVRAEVVCSTK